MRKLVRSIALCTATLLAGCGTAMTTTTRGIDHVETTTFAAQTQCRSIPRVYSGVIYDTCTSFLHNAQNDAAFQQWKIIPYLIDGVASAAADTLLLPYTAYRQYADGSLHLPSQGH